MIDLNKFKKIEEGKDCTVLLHEKGHELKIAHHGLSKEFRKQLSDLPIHASGGGRLGGMRGAHRMKNAGEFMHPAKNSGLSGPSKPSVKSSDINIDPHIMPGQKAALNFTEPASQGTRPSASIPGAPGKHEPDDISAGARNAYYFENGKYPPCINSSCKSYGKPHPNCKCYGPTSQAGTFMAEGGAVSGYCSENRPHQQGCEYYADGENVGKDGALEQALESGPEEQQPAIPQDLAQPSTSPNLDTMQTSQPEQAPQEQPVQPEDMPAPDSVAPTTPQDHAQQQTHSLLNEDAAIQSDIDAGHIHPESYSELFGKKDTVGKVGTIFGLLVGGMGSGLSKQPNMLMQMMNNEVQNDLRAQESSATNRQNLLRINQDAITKMAGAHLTETEAKQKAWALTNMQENRVLLNQLVSNRAKIPDGSPQAVAYDQAMTILRPMVENENASIAAKFGLASAIQRFGLGGQGKGGAGGSTMAMKAGLLGNDFKEMGEDIEQKSVKGIPSVAGQVATRPIPEGVQQQLQAMEVLDQKGKDLLNFVKQNTNTWNPQKRARAKQKVEEMKNFYNNSINGGALTNGRLGWYDEQFSKHPTDIMSQLLGSTEKFKETIDSNDLRRNLLLNNYGLSPTLKSRSGKTMVFKGGKWVYR